MLSNEGVILLAIKADQIPGSASTLQQLEEWIHSDPPATQALLRLASERRVVVLIDQLDALSEVMDQRSERLGTIMRFVNFLRGTKNLNILVSCREFEFRYDARFKTLDAEKVLLGRLSWEQVEPLITARNFETSGWSEDVRKVLCTPQHLRMFLDHLSADQSLPLFESYQGLLTRIIEERLLNAHGPRPVEAAEQIAALMSREEELWLGRHRFDPQFHEEVMLLEREGFLRAIR